MVHGHDDRRGSEVSDQPFITSTHFKKEPDAAKWRPDAVHRVIAHRDGDCAEDHVRCGHARAMPERAHRRNQSVSSRRTIQAARSYRPGLDGIVGECGCSIGSTTALVLASRSANSVNSVSHVDASRPGRLKQLLTDASLQ